MIDKKFTYSIIIPTYNRRVDVLSAVGSAIIFASSSKLVCEIIVVDDFSNDDTAKLLTSKYSRHISSKFLKIIILDKNYGVIVARNIGARHARGSWLIFLDSDNKLIKNTFDEIYNIISLNPKYPAHMFRSVDSEFNLIGREIYPTVITLHYMINFSIGECAGVYKKLVYLEFFDNSTICRLRRIEALAIYRCMKEYGPYRLSNFPTRVYKESSADRLCSSKALRRDSHLLAEGFFLILIEFYQYMKVKTVAIYLLRIFYYLSVTFLKKIKN